MSKSKSVKDIYAKYKMDKTKETQGIVKDFGDFVVTIARAGGSNIKYNETMEELFRPFNQVMELDEMNEQKAREVYYRVYARSIILRWQYKAEDGSLLDGLGLDDSVVVNGVTSTVLANEDNIVDLFKASHDLWIDIKKIAETREGYSLASKTAAAKN